VASVVEEQILHPRCGSQMPAKLATGQDAKDVAAYVAQAAAAPGTDTGRLADVGAGKAGGPAGRRIFNGAGCSTCHVLSDVGATGTVGPNLDRSSAGRSRAFIRESIVEPDVGFAIGAGTDVAVETADVVLMRSDPLDVATAITIARGTLRKMRQNLAWAVGYNSLALPIAAGVFVPVGLTLRPEIGALAMSGSSIIVAVNAVALKRLLPRMSSEARERVGGGHAIDPTHAHTPAPDST
jgi:mono/diheme cytochrome c family protein